VLFATGKDFKCQMQVTQGYNMKYKLPKAIGIITKQPNKGVTNDNHNSQLPN
jgi:hypothetical protein